MTQPACLSGCEGLAALGICESLLLALTDLKVISEEEARELLMKVAITHNGTPGPSPAPDINKAVAEIVQRMLVGKNGVPH
jgi:hypothetical protein